MAFPTRPRLHDPVYVLGWIAFSSLVGSLVLAYQGKSIPAVVGVALGSSVTLLGQAARAWIKGWGDEDEGEEKP